MRHRRSRPAKTISSYKQAYQLLIRHRTWQSLRLRHLFFHDHCEKCGAGWADTSLEVHHIKPLADGHSFDEIRRLAYSGSNLVTLCHRCHCEAHKELRRENRNVEPKERS